MSFPATFVEDFHIEASVRKMEYRRLGRTNLMVSKLGLTSSALVPFHGFVRKKYFEIMNMFGLYTNSIKINWTQ